MSDGIVVVDELGGGAIVQHQLTYNSIDQDFKVKPGSRIQVARSIDLVEEVNDAAYRGTRLEPLVQGTRKNENSEEKIKDKVKQDSTPRTRLHENRYFFRVYEYRRRL